MKQSDRVIKVLVLGTSNSILKNGYAAGLIDSSNKIEVVNKSIGASPGIQFGSFLSMNFNEFNYVIFDSLPNDEQYSYETKGYQYTDLQNQILFEILSSISCKTNLIIMGFVCKRYFINKTNVYFKRKDIAIKLGVQFIDVPEILESYLRVDKSTTLYEAHPAHPSRILSYEIGLYLGGLLLLEKNEYEKNEYEKNQNKDYSKNFKCIHSKEFVNPDSLLIRKNSLLTEEFSVIENFNNKIFKLDQDGRLLGFYVNALETNCELIISDSSSNQSQVNLYYRRKSGGLLKLFVPLNQYVKMISLKMRKGDICTSIIHPRMTVLKTDDKSPTLHISSFLFWKGIPSNENIPLNNSSLPKKNYTIDIIHSIYKNKYSNRKLNRFKNQLPILRGKAGTVLVFDQVKNQCIHLDEKTCLLEQLNPVLISIDETKIIRLFIIINNLNLIPLYISKSGITKSYSDNCFKSDSELIDNGNGFFLVKTEGYYLCAEPSGRVVSNRKIAKNWEMFTICNDALIY